MYQLDEDSVTLLGVNIYFLLNLFKILVSFPKFARKPQKASQMFNQERQTDHIQLFWCLKI